MAQTQSTITNVASLGYDAGGNPVGPISSNPVVTQILDPAIPPTISLYLQGDGNGATPTVVDGGCAATQNGNTVGLIPTSMVAPGMNLYVKVHDDLANRNAAERDTIVARIALGGQSLTLTLVETGVDTADFTGVLSIGLSGDPGNCTLGVSGEGGDIVATYAGNMVATVNAHATTTPYNVVFDSSSRKVVDGSKITIVDAATGQPAQVHGIDGTSTFPATVVSGTPVKDSAGRTYAVPPGGYLFPQLAPGTYRLLVEPTANYVFASATSPADFASHPVIGGKPVNVTDGSYGKTFSLAAAFDMDIPLDPSDAGLIVAKTVSAVAASPGDYLQYRVTVQNRSATSAIAAATITDILPQGLRYQGGSFKINGVKAADPEIAADGRHMVVQLSAIEPGGTLALTYVLAVTSNAPVGDAVNAVSVRGGSITSNVARATVRISGGFFSDSVTIIGRVVSDSCNPTSPDARPIPDVRILLEDGTYVLTDENGQYHIENVRPGLHVAQIDRNSLPPGYTPARCGDDTRRAGSDISQFIDARGGALWRADFYLSRAPDAPALPNLPTTALDPVTPALPSGAASLDPETAPDVAPQAAIADTPGPAAASIDDDGDARASGLGVSWIEQATGQAAILFPPDDHNPRAPAIRVVVARAVNDTVAVSVNGQIADALHRDPGATNPQGTAAVDIWGGLPLKDGRNLIVARVEHADGSVETLSREVSYTNSADRAEVVREKSVLVADGRTRPIIAVRVLDRNGKPVRAGVSGSIDVDAPYETADAQRRRRESQLVGTTQPAQSGWHVTGDDGIAYITLAPTTQTGEVLLDLHLRDGARGISRLSDSGSVLDRGDQMRVWLSPGQQDWVVVGFAAGSAGYTTLATQAETLSESPGKTDQVDGQVKLYAKGRISGKWLLTLAYDNDKKSDPQRRQSLLSTIDPAAYYTLYGDSAQQGYDAQSTKNIYVRIEAPQFYALFGDFSAGFNDTELGLYQRILTGVKTQYQSQKTRFTAFAASTPFRHQREEIQGQGVSGPYQLQRQDMVANTDLVTLQTRDRVRPELIVDSRTLTRFVDYDIDYARGTITLRQPLASRDTSFNPQYLIAEYDIYGSARDRMVAGVRVAQKVGRKLTIGATGLQHDDDRKTRLGAVDVTLELDPSLRVRAEGGYSGGGDQTGHAYVVEADKRTSTLEARAYVREQSLNYGVGEQNAVEAGYRKVGVDAAALVSKSLTVAGSAFQTDDLTSQARRRSIRADVQAKVDARTTATGTARAVEERDSAGSSNTITQLGLAVSRTMFDNKLKLTGETQISIGGEGTVTTPSIYRVGADYDFGHGIRSLVEYQVASGAGVTAGTLRAGIDVTPWRGGEVTASWNRQRIAENGDRTFAVMGMKQSMAIAKNWSADVAVDSSQPLSGGSIPADPVNPLQAPAMGGTYLGSTLDSDYTAISLGLAYQTPKLSWTTRAEVRIGDYDRRGVTTAIVRQLADGRVLGGSGALYTMRQTDGGKVDHGDAAFAVALRAPTSRLQILDKLEGVYDRVALGTGLPSGPGLTIPLGQSTIAGLAENGSYGPIAAIARTATVSRIVNNLAINWIASPQTDAGYRTQVSLYYGAKYAVQTFDGDRYGGFTDMLSVELRHDLTPWFDIGFQGGVKHSWSQGTLQYTLGPTIGISPARNTWISLGYNFTGFDDRDFSGARSTVDGIWAAFRVKFDEELLGLAKRRGR